MTKAITLKNLPAHISQYGVERILYHYQVPYRTVALEPFHDNGDTVQCAHVLLKSNGSQKLLRKLDGVEVEDRIMEAQPTDEEKAQTLLNQRSTQEKKPKQESRAANPAKTGQFQSKPSDQTPQEPFERSEELSSQPIEPVPFHTFGISDTLMRNLERMEIQQTTPIQTLAIPPALEGHDIIGKAQTGSGKTLAFGLPIVERLLRRPSLPRGLQALILTPTRELAVQIDDVVKGLIQDTEIVSSAIYGGEHVLDQYVRLMDDVHIMIATPGRLLDMQKRGRLRIDMAEVFVLDEADRMLDMGFLPDIQTIFKCFYEHPQSMMFSATIPKDLKKLTGVNLKDPVFIDAGTPDMTPVESVHQEVVELRGNEKDNALRDLLAKEEGTAIVFVRTKRATEQLYNKLKMDGLSVGRIHGDIEQSARMRAMEAFRQNKIRFLIATDVASRGLDIENVAHVINYDLPMTPEDHLHRIGRTARAGASGQATTFVTPQEKRSLKPYRRVLGLKD